ncbi:nicotinate-nucleotide pyrophosphorylase [carboxylating]-like isoform X2 [Varroa destructor]|uniref:Nicotinate-nucleotide pyrophosphorylase [carboxylating] n=1 Tax=Varroa destructor TaxID=109461 RepID=A0A7M7KVV2_VARDE|nr:nicotinate-nucleotide pyrophosphorylase [carboxylating]-like isoform X2 [Varroa destructor]
MAEFLLNVIQLEIMARSWISEDHLGLDASAAVVGDAAITAHLWGVLAGVPFANAIVHELNLNITWHRNEGEWLHPTVKVAEICGPARRVLLAERAVLNTLARASGVATKTRGLREQLNLLNWQGILAGTRRTTPGFRLIEKYSLVIGGADTHRNDLASMVMLNANHIRTAGNVEKAVTIARRVGGFTKKVEVECLSLEDAINAANAGADIVMLQDFKSKELNETTTYLKKEFPRLIIEASGYNITADNIEDFALPAVDIVSTAQLTQGYSSLEFNLKVDEPHADCNE